MTATQMRAHGVSLPLFALMQRLEDASLEDLTSGIKEGLSQLFLNEHLRLILVLKDGEMEIDLEPNTEYGHAVLQELQSRSVVTSCPPGECDYKANSCIWCGEPKKA